MDQRWNDVEAALASAKGICTDGCHKIYILMDDGEVDVMRDCGYEVFETDNDAFDAFETVEAWYDESCNLRFVSAVRTVEGNPNDGFIQLIPQFAEEEDEEDDD